MQNYPISHVPWMWIRCPRLKFARFARRGWFASDMIPYINITHDMIHHIFMYDGRDKNINSQTNGSLKYISNIHGGVMPE